jgi:DNA topoisomerase 2-associated protein PAT1
MTQGDKDFITRIQVSQLVAPDPQTEDFYAQVYGAILRSRAGAVAVDNGVLTFGSSGGIALSKINPGMGANRPQRAMQRMEAQVDRLLANARMREKEKGQHRELFLSSRLKEWHS